MRIVERKIRTRIFTNLHLDKNARCNIPFEDDFSPHCRRGRNAIACVKSYKIIIQNKIIVSFVLIEIRHQSMFPSAISSDVCRTNRYEMASPTIWGTVSACVYHVLLRTTPHRPMYILELFAYGNRIELAKKLAQNN